MFAKSLCITPFPLYCLVLLSLMNRAAGKEVYIHDECKIEGNERCLRYSDADIAYWNDDKHKPEKYYKVRCGFSNVKARQAWYIIDSEVKPCASTCKEWCEDKGGPVPVFWSKCGDDPYTRLNSDRKVETLTLTPNEEKKRPACLGS